MHINTSPKVSLSFTGFIKTKKEQSAYRQRRDLKIRKTESSIVILVKVIKDRNKVYLVDSYSVFLISKIITISG